MVKNKIYGNLIQGNKISLDTDHARELHRRYNDIMIARELKITIQQVRDIPQPYYDDIVLIVNKELAYRKARKKDEEREARRKARSR